MAKRTNVYPDWAEKFRAKGKTIRKVKDGYALYACTSEYVKGGYPKAKQEYLGMITEKDGFIPKKTGGQEAVYLEYGLSHFVVQNFRREFTRHVFQSTDELFKLGIIAFVFGSAEDIYIRSSYLTYSDADRLCDIRSKMDGRKIERIRGVINDAFCQRVPEESNRIKIRNLLLLCVVEKGPRSVRKPAIPKELTELFGSFKLKFNE